MNAGESSHQNLQYYLEVQSPGIDGWLHVVAKFMIPIISRAQSDANIRGDIVEIGVWHGLTLLMFGHLATGQEHVDGYDIELKPELLSNIKKFGTQATHVHEANSLEMTTWSIMDGRNKNSIRMFHVDGYHTHAVALNDLRLAVGTADPQGVVMLDDFFSPTLPGVTQALHTLIFNEENNGFFPFALGGGKVFLCQDSMSDFYRKSLTELMPMPSLDAQDVDQLFSRTVLIYEMW